LVAREAGEHRVESTIMLSLGFVALDARDVRLVTHSVLFNRRPRYRVRAVTAARIVRMFTAAGFARGVHAPAEALTVYRGTPPRSRVRVSWTLDRERADWFANRYARVGTAASVYSRAGPSVGSLVGGAAPCGQLGTRANDRSTVRGWLAAIQAAGCGR
jgi:hypothetical protein